MQDGNGGVASAVVTVTVHGVAVVPVDPQPMLMMMSMDPGPVALGTTTEVVFVDGRVPDPQSFAIDGREVVVLNSEQDGLEQMAAALSGRTGVTAVHVVSHGGDGYLTLGSGNIDANAVQSGHEAALQAVAAALTADGDILIYACDFASGEAGQSTLQLLAQYTSADVAASSDTTGDQSLGGDWALEATVGTVEATTLAPADWAYTLNIATSGASEAPAAVPVAASEPVAVVNEPVRLQRVESLEVALQGAVVRTTETVVDVQPVRSMAEAPVEPEVSTRGFFLPVVAAGTEAWAGHAVHSDLWVLADSRQGGTLPDAGDVLDFGATEGAAQGLRAQLSRWSSGWGQRPLTRGALRA